MTRIAHLKVSYSAYLRLCLGISAGVLPLQLAQADQTWDNGTGNQDWNNPENWSNNAFPGNTIAFISTEAAAAFPIIGATPNSGTPTDIKIGSGGGVTGRLDHSAGTAGTGNGNWFFVGSSGGSGSYNLANTSAAGGGITGFAQGSGSVTAGRFYIAGADFNDNGTGVVKINTSGTLTTTNATDSGMILANAWNGTANATAYFESGTVNVGSETWVGRSGTGIWNQSGGTLNSNSYLVAGRESPVAGQFSAGNGTINLSGGTINAAMTSGYAVMGSFTGSTGALNVSGTGTFNSPVGGMIVGESGTGTLTVSETGLVNIGIQGYQLGSAASGSGTIHLNGGTLAGGKVYKVAGSGTFNFNGGTLKATANAAEFMQGLTAANVLAGGAVIDTNGFNVTIGQALVDGGGNGGLIKNGAGTLSLGGASTYTGSTQVNAGTLLLDGTATSNIVVGGTATFGGTGSTTGSLTFNSGATLSASTSLPLVANGVSFAGLTHLTFNGTPQNGSQYVLVQYGAGQSVSGLSNLTSTYDVDVVNDTANSQILVTVNSKSISWNLTDGTWVNGGSGWTGGGTTYSDGDDVTFGERSAASTVTLSGALLPGSVTVSNSSNPYVFTGSGSIAGLTTLTKNGGGALTLATANSYSGSTLLNAGTLNVNHASALGSSDLIVAGGILNNTSGSPVVSTANHPQLWEADVTFTGSNSLDLGKGAVSLGGAGDNRVVTVAANTLAVGLISSATQGLVKQGAGTLEVENIFPAASTIPGVLEVAAGTLQINRSNTNAAASGDFVAAGITGSGTIINGAGVERWFFCSPTSGSFTFTGVLANGNAGTLGFRKAGAGTQVLSGANTYTGRTTVAEGTLSLTQSLLGDSSQVFIETNGTLDLPHGTIDQVGTLNISGVNKPNGTYDASTDPGRITGSGKIRVGPPATGYSAWATSIGLTAGSNDGATNNPDGDGFENGTEFILGGHPLSGSNNPKVYSFIADGSVDLDATKELILTIAVPVGTPAFTVGSPNSTASFAGFGITVRGSFTLDAFPATVTPVDPVTTDLPPAPQQGGVTYEYRSFSLNGSNGTSGRGFLQVSVTNP